MKEKFEKLVQDFCKLCAVAEASDVAAGAPVAVDGVNFSLVYSEKTAPDRVMVFCDYGHPPEDRKAVVYRALLEANLFVYNTDTAVFSVSPEHGNVICASRFMLEGLRGEQLRDILAQMSHSAKAWREHYLDPEKPVKKGPADSGGVAAKLAAQLRTGRM